MNEILLIFFAFKKKVQLFLSHESMAAALNINNMILL